MTAPNRQARRAAAATEAKAPPPATPANDAAKAEEKKPFMVVFTPEEGQALVDLLDVAVKSVGLQGAGPAIHLATKIKQAFDAGQLAVKKQA